ncbi:hypothetical protein SCHPADRAFT_433496 [Schizopora paradoxa]|uniref:Velvet domain-containing protein n=1 Tax=Schizopora paradoxa TaxID=27342 RepID=A0A0H2RJG4_9AGAM|nr:hypothetical protein SCHPADRAFT_433496 [Schizopora paradoxa]
MSPVMQTPNSARPPVVIAASPPPLYAHAYGAGQGYAPPQPYGHQSSASPYTPYTYAPPSTNNNGGNGSQATSGGFRAPGGGPIQVLASPVLSMPPMQSGTSSSSSANVVVPLGAAQTQFSATAGAMASPALNAAPPTSSSHTRLPFPSSNARDRDWERDRDRDRRSNEASSHIPLSSSSSSLQTPISAPGAAPTASTSSGGSRDRGSRRHSTASIGKPVTFDTGPFAGRRVRAEIVEVQKADLGRKCADPPSASTSSTAHPSTSAGGNAAPGRAGGNGVDGPGEARSVRKDRRPLDPPPVVSLQFYEVEDDGSERPIPAEDVEIGGLICQVDLFKVTIPPSAQELAGMPALNPAAPPPPLHSLSHHGTLPPPPFPPQVQPHGYYHNSGNISNNNQVHVQSIQPLTVPNAPLLPLDASGENARKRKHEGYGHEGRPGPGGPGASSSAQTSPVSPVGGGGSYMFGDASGSSVNVLAIPGSGYVPPPPPNAVHNANASASSSSSGAGPLPPIDTGTLPLPTESDKLTRCLFGEYYSHAASILDLSGRAAIYFVFSDLSVKLEGLFRPRYRFFDLFSRCDWSADVPVLAECWGGVFAVYSTKEFPGLKASSELTKHLNRWGIRVNIRETERKRRAPGGGNGGTRRGSEEEEDDGATVTGAGPSEVMDAPRRFLEHTANAQRQKAERARGGKGKKGGWSRRKPTPSTAAGSSGANAGAGSSSGLPSMPGSGTTLPPMQGYDGSVGEGSGRGKR